MGEKKYIQMIDLLRRWRVRSLWREEYVSESVGPNSRGRLPERWGDRVKK